MTGARHQRGMNLVELMVAMTLGLVLVGGAGQIFLSNTQAFRLQDSVSNLQQSGRLVMEMMIADIHRAGLDMQTATFTTAGISGRQASASTTANPGLLMGSDEFTVAYVAPETMTDCEGREAQAGQTVVNRYFIRMDTNPAIPALFCAGNVDAMPSTTATAGTALLRGVEGMQVLYGIAENTGNGVASPTMYVPAQTGVTMPANQLVGAVQLALLVRTENGIQGIQPPNDRIVLLDAFQLGGVSQEDLAAVTVNGQYPVHRVFTGTAAIRNPAFASFPP